MISFFLRYAWGAHIIAKAHKIPTFTHEEPPIITILMIQTIKSPLIRESSAFDVIILIPL